MGSEVAHTRIRVGAFEVALNMTSQGLFLIS